MTQLKFDFSKPAVVPAPGENNDYHQVPVTQRQLDYARRIAKRRGVKVPEMALVDRKTLSRWIDAQDRKAGSAFTRYPSSKQVAFAERLARMKRRSVPDECFKDKALMARWIDSNL